MRFFKLHIGDYTSATTGLSVVEHGVYYLLLLTYYANERPLPGALKDVCQLIGIKRQGERRAVQIILRKFFFLEDDGWHQKRADWEIGWFQSNGDNSRTNGKLGGRPRKSKSVPEAAQNRKILTELRQYTPRLRKINDLENPLETMPVTTNKPMNHESSPEVTDDAESAPTPAGARSSKEEC